MNCKGVERGKGGKGERGDYEFQTFTFDGTKVLLLDFHHGTVVEVPTKSAKNLDLGAPHLPMWGKRHR